MKKTRLNNSIVGIALVAVLTAIGWAWLAANNSPTAAPFLLASDSGFSSQVSIATIVLGIIGIALLPAGKQNIHRWFAAGLLIIVVTPLILSGFWPNGLLGISDWDYYFSYHEALRRLTLEFQEVPTWNPYICGGTSAVGDPEFPVFAPTFLLELVFGIPVGLRLVIVTTTAAGALGMLVLARRLRLSVFAGLIAALAYAFGSVNLLEVVEGHPNVFSAMYLPWIFWAWLNAYRANAKHEIRNSKQIQSLKPVSSFGNSVLRIISNFGIRFSNLWALLCGVLLALTFFQGGIYLLMYTAGAFLFLLLVARDRRAAFFTTLIAGLWALGFAAIKLLPVLLWLQQFQDKVYASSALTLPYLHRILLGRYLHGLENVVPNQGGGWHEYGAYLGPVVLVLAGLALFRPRRRLVWQLWLAAIIAALVSSTGPLLKPLFDQTPWLPRSNISRVILFAILPLSLLASIGLDAVRDELSKLLSRAVPKKITTAVVSLLVIIIVGAVAFDLTTLANQLSHQAFVLQPDPHPLPPAAPPIAYTINDHRIRHKGVDYTRAYTSILAGYGTQSYCTVLGPDVAVKTIQHRDEDTSYVLVVHDDAGTAELISWRPDEIVVRAVLDKPGDVIINTNFVAGWTVNGAPARDIAGRLATNVPAGEHTLTFRYVAPGYRTGQLITLVAAMTATVALIGSRRRNAPNPDTTHRQAK